MTIIRPDLPGLPETVPARMVNEFTYCPRLFHLEWVQSRFTANDDVEEGLYIHRVVDTQAGDLPDKADAWEGRRATSVWLTSTRLGLTGKIDLVEGDAGGKVVPVDYKKGRPTDDGGAWPSDRVQSLIQALLLRESGYDVSHAEIWYAEVRRRIKITVDDDAIAEIVETLRALWKVAGSEQAPAPLVNSPKCPRCSLVGICLPDETNALAVRARERTALRRVMAPDRHSRPVYVTTQGATVGVRRGRLEVFQDGAVAATFRLIDVSQVCLFGNVSVSTQAVRELMAREAPLLWFTYGGWFCGMAEGLPAKNVELRRAQYSAPPPAATTIAKAMIAGKIHNSRVLLRRNSRGDVAAVVDQLRALVTSARGVETIPSLLGIEGTAARLYFGKFTTMVASAAKVDVSPFDENGRARRPPPDPLNALLSFTYSLLIKDLTTTLHSVGLDPYLGFLHRPRFGRPALSLDLAEEFRPLIAESVVLQLLNNGEVRDSSFVSRAGGCQLQADGRRSVLRAYERRLDHEITHPHFGYRVTYRRALEVQARMLAAHLLGELPTYTPFVTR
ncbi:MAG: CRISPR-associated endonuclease Cas1 [Micropruina sp.]|uniref:CRISPR-associated endonuclease Cas4g/Cas1g n=1 Tax=Micropruina sp. TaxID=2737536 RepID=UPI0039E4A347